MARSLTFSRRRMLQAAALGVSSLSSASWLRALAADAATHPARKKSVILLWLAGGPATIDLWDLKPGNENGGPFQEIETAVPGLRISEHLPKLAGCASDMVLVRSISSKEGDHGRATHLVKTGYRPQGAIQFPALGALIARELVAEPFNLPGFVSIGAGRNVIELGGGFLGPRFSPLAIAADPNRGNNGISTLGPDDLKVPDLERPAALTAERQADRLSLLGELEGRFANGRTSPVIDALQSATGRAARMMEPEAAQAFELQSEDAALRDRYGRNLFGQGCLLARRLVERGVPFVEVSLGGWDTHQDNFERVKGLSQTLDTAFAALLNDLRDRGLLDSTLVVCQGEFGRTPKINARTGRDHWPASWATALAGGGIHGGQVIGRTSADGVTIEDHPASVPDVIATVCRAVGIDPRKQNISNVTRPIRIADPDAQAIEEVL